MPCFQMSPTSLGVMMVPVMAMMTPVAVAMSVIAGPVIAVVGIIEIARRRGRGGHEKRRGRHSDNNAWPVVTPCGC